MTPFNQKYPPQMVAEIAYGMEEPVDIAFRYGISASEYRKLAQNAHFQAEVAAKTAELVRAGHTVKVKAQYMAEDLLETMYLRAKDPKATFTMVHEAVKTIAKLADLEPKTINTTPQGAGFSITINIPQHKTTETGTVIEASTEKLSFPTFQASVAEDIEVESE